MRRKTLFDKMFELPVLKFFNPLYQKYKSIWMYLFFGGLTTVINFILYYGLYNILHVNNVVSTLIAWFLASTFAYFTNRYYVFESEQPITIKEMVSYYSSRVATGLLDALIMYVSVDVLLMNSSIWKIISSALTAVINYILGKLVLKKENKKQ